MTTRSRWVVLAAYTAVAGVSQTLWLNYAPIMTQVMKRYHVGELTAGTLVLVFPLLYVVLSLPAGAFIDRRGYKVGVGVGAVAQALFAALRIADQSFWMLLAAQIGIALAQPFILNGISKLVADWFDEEHSAIATGIGTMGMFLGMAVAMAATPPLVGAFGMRGATIVYAIAAAAAAVAFLVLVQEREAVSEEPAPIAWSVLWQRDLILLCCISFLGLGFFNGITTWLEQLLGRNGIGAVQAGSVGGAMIVAGVVGSAVVPALSDRFRRRKVFVVGCAVVALLLLYPLGTGTRYGSLLVLGSALGFFFLPAYALLLEMCSEVAGQANAGMATGILLLMGNAGGVVVVVAMPLVKGNAELWSLGPLHLLAAVLVLAIVLATVVHETFQLRAERAS